MASKAPHRKKEEGEDCGLDPHRNNVTERPFWGNGLGGGHDGREDCLLAGPEGGRLKPPKILVEAGIVFARVLDIRWQQDKCLELRETAEPNIWRIMEQTGSRGAAA